MKLFTSYSISLFTGALFIALTSANAATLMTLRTDDKLQTIEVKGMNTVYQFNVHVDAGARFGDLTNLTAGIGVERVNVLADNCVIRARQKMLPNGINQFILRQDGDCYGILGREVSVAGYYNEFRAQAPRPIPAPAQITCRASATMIGNEYGLDVKKYAPNGSFMTSFGHFLDQAVGELNAMVRSRECVKVNALADCYVSGYSLVISGHVLTGTSQISAPQALELYREAGVCRR